MALGVRPPAQQPPPEPPPLVARYGSDSEWLAWKRLLFIKYLLLTGRLDPGSQDR